MWTLPFLLFVEYWPASVFFFMKKAAYEVRISDASSDVCSSDLASASGPSTPALPPMPAIDRALYETVTTIEALDRWIEEARAAHVVAIDTETASLDSVTGTLVGVSMATAPGRACYIPLGHGGTDMLDRKSTRLNSSH